MPENTAMLDATKLEEAFRMQFAKRPFCSWGCEKETESDSRVLADGVCHHYDGVVDVERLADAIRACCEEEAFCSLSDDMENLSVFASLVTSRYNPEKQSAPGGM